MEHRKNPFTPVVQKCEDFFSQDVPGRGVPTSILRDFVRRWDAQTIANAIGKLDPAVFPWQEWFSDGGKSTHNKRRHVAGLQDALGPVYAISTSSATDSTAIFRLVLCALAAKNETVLRKVLIPELKKVRGLPKAFVRAQIDPHYNPDPPHEPNTLGADNRYLPEAATERFMVLWDECI